MSVDRKKNIKKISFRVRALFSNFQKSAPDPRQQKFCMIFSKSKLFSINFCIINKLKSNQSNLSIFYVKFNRNETKSKKKDLKK